MRDKSLLEEIKAKADIVDIISSYINVTKKGKHFTAVCPFHDDHTPSLHIRRDTQTFNCYVCQTGGDVFSFVQKIEKISFPSAIKKVAQIINFSDPRLENKSSINNEENKNDQIISCLKDISLFYTYCLNISEGEIASDYLNSRGIGENTINKFNLGYSLKDGKKIVDFLQSKGYSLSTIESTGICINRNSELIDANAARLIFPIKNSYDDVVGFSARKLNNDMPGGKYVNSPETAVFKKSHLLYNLYNAKQSCKHDNYIYLCEGYLDVFALDKIGINSVVALMGTALTEDHIRIFKSLGVEVRICLDGDTAGRNATMKIIALLNKNNINHRIVGKIKEIRDPDEILTQDGEDALRKHINCLNEPFDFALDYYQNVSPLETMSEKTKVINFFTPFIKSLSNNSLNYENAIIKLSKATNFDVSVIKNEILNNSNNIANNTTENNITFPSIKTYINNKSNEGQYNIAMKRKLNKLLTIESMFIKEMLKGSEAIEFCNNNSIKFSDELFKQISLYIVKCYEEDDYYSSNSVINEICLDISKDKRNEQILNIVTLLLPSDKELKYTTDSGLSDMKNELDNVRNSISKTMAYKNLNNISSSIEEKIKNADSYSKK